MIEQIVAQIEAQQKTLVAGVMNGQCANDLLKLGMLLGQHQGLAKALDIILGKNAEAAEARGDKV